MQTLLGKHWHHLPPAEVVELLDTDAEAGLDLFEVQHRQQHFGPNRLTAHRGPGPVVRFLRQLNNPLIYVLVASGVVTAVLKDPVDAGVILAVVLVNAVVGYLQESRAERAIESLAETLTAEAAVIRAGHSRRLPAAELVPGDVVALRSGDRVPADMRLIRSRDLQVAEAALTGESAPVEKDALADLPPDTPLAERRTMTYASTLVTYGQATGVVTATGDSTEVGRISELIAGAADLATPLTRKMAQFSRLVLYAILALAAGVLAVGLWRGQPMVETFMSAIALAVAMIPEGLPAALTVTLAIGVSRMARRRAIIRRLPAVETLGSVTVVCSDKTGTLTRNEMTVQHILAGGECYEVNGTGYDPAGEIWPAPAGSGALAEVLSAGLLCSDAELVEKDGRWEPHGDPTEVALVVAARKGGLDEALRARHPRLDVIPFESQHQFMATLHDAGEGRPRPVYLKGSVEAVLPRCATALGHDGAMMSLDAPAIHRHVDDMAVRGLRVLALARGERPAGTATLDHAGVAGGLVFLGLQGMIDPPRAEAMSAVAACQSAGIQVKMITGDHALTAAAIGRQLGLHGADGAALTGQQLAALGDAEIIDAAARTAVFARVSPEQKLRLVEALQARGQVVAMTGDGVNDGPALKQADVGIAMGVTGTDVAREAADMVLTDDNFATIESAVEEGRGVYDNLTKIIAWTLPTNLGEGLVILAGLVAGAVLPILPIQILWINLVTAAALGLVLALEPKEPGIMVRLPRDPRAPILSRALLSRVILVGAIILAGAFGLFEWELGLGAGVDQARTAAVNAVVVVAIFYLLNCRSLARPAWQVSLRSNRWVLGGIGAMLGLQALFTYAPAMNRLFASAPITLEAWLRIAAIGAATFAAVEVEKWIRRRRS